MQNYVINFLVWWYGVKVRHMFELTLQRFIFILQYTNTLTMARYLTVPMFQDESGIGKVISFLVRGTWVWFGGMASVVIGLPFWIVLVVYALLPIIVAGEVVWGIILLIS